MKVAIYCRLSEEDRNKQFKTDDSGSIQNQKAMLLQYAMGQGWELYNIYSDDDYAGADRQRPEFIRLLKDAEAHKFDVVLCKTQSRFTRELELVEKYIHGLFPVWGIRFVSIVDNADTANKGNKKARQINGLVNEWYLEDMSDNIRSVLTSRRVNGFHIGAFALYGYKKDPDQKGHLIVDEEAAAVVREVFSLFAQGYGKTAIARMLNDRGIPNPTEYKRLHGLRYKRPDSKMGTLWKYSSIANMLANEIYIGNMVQGKYGSISYKTKQNKPRPKSEWYIVHGTHEPIIGRELWDRVQALVRQRAKAFDTGSIGLFARKVRCASCGYTMRSHKCRGRYYLQCANRHVSEDSCIGAFIPAAKLEEVIIDELKRLSAKYLNKAVLEQGRDCCSSLHRRKQSLLSHMAACEKRVAEYARGIRELYMDKVKGLISENDYWEMSKEFMDKRSQLEHALKDIQKQLAETEEKILVGIDRRELVEQYVNPKHLTREMVDALIDHIVVCRRIPGTRRYPIEIHWNF